MRDQFKVWVPITVRWGDMDAYGHVNNAVFFTFFECVRIEYFARIGMDNKSETNLLAPAIVSATINFRQQLHYPAELEAGARAIKIGTSSFTLEHALIAKGNEELFADGTSIVVLVDYAVGKSVPLPDALKDRIRNLEENPAL